MFGLGTIINTGAIIVGGLIGLAAGKGIKAEKQQAFETACGVSVMFLGIAGAMEGMLSLEEGALKAGRSMFVVLCLLLGAVLGELIDLEGLLERFGEWLKRKTGSSKDVRFVEGFLTTSFTVCIGAMAVIGSLQDGISGDFSLLATKSILDFIIVIVMTGTMGKGCIFSAIPVFVLQGSITLLARFLAPLITDAATVNLSLVGNVLIFCVGLNLVWGKKVRVANLLPAILLAVAAAYLPL